jgi:prophage tail gpP-like protein
MRIVSLGFAVALVSSGAGCWILAPHESVILPVTEIAAPASIPAGTQLSVVLTVQTGGCTRFDRIETERTATRATITAWGREPASGRNVQCTADIRYDRHTVNFNPPFGSTFDIVINREGEGPALARRVRIE